MKFIYYFWNAIFTILPIYILVKSKAWLFIFANIKGLDNEFPLFTDIFTMFIVMPCFFLLFVGIPLQLVLIFIHRPLKRLILTIIILAFACSFVAILFPYSIKYSILISSVAFFVSVIYLLISYILYNMAFLNHKIK